MGKIRIIGGTHRSRQLVVLDSDGLRPTLDRVKETLFNWLGQDLTNLTCLDLFAGSGSLGFEALSRNARKVVLVEKEAKVVTQLRSNAKLLGCSTTDNISNTNNPQLQIIQQDALSFLRSNVERFDVVFLDPPYQSDLLEQALPLLAQYLQPRGLVYLEFITAPQLVGFEILKQGKAGSVNYALLKNEE